MKIEELMPELRAGQKVRCKSRPEIDYFYFVEDAVDMGNFEELEGNYTGFTISVNGTEWQSAIDGAIMMVDDWELYDESTKPA